MFESILNYGRQLLFRRDTIEIVRPPLHHLPAFRQVLSVVVSGPYFISLGVGELPFNHTWRKTILVENRARRRPKSVAGRFRVIAHAIKSVKHSVLAHETGRLMLVCEYVVPLTGQ